MDLKQYRSKLIGNDDERAVSPVIGVILMVAITVILAAVIAAFVLDLGQGQSANPQAGVQFDEDSGSSDVTVTLISDDRTDSGITVDGPGCSDVSISSVGGTTTCDNTGTVTVTATYDGNTAVISTWEP